MKQKFSPFKKINIQIERGETEHNILASTFAQSLSQGIGTTKKIKEKIDKNLNAQGAADLLAYKLSDDREHFSDDQRNFYEFVWTKSLYSTEELRSKLPSNEEYFFLKELAKSPSEDAIDLSKLGLKYGYDKEKLEDLKSKGLIDFLTNDEKETLALHNLSEDETLKDLKKRGFVNYLDSDEKKFLVSLSKFEQVTQDLIEREAIKKDLDPKSIQRLKKDELANYPSDAEVKLLVKMKGGLDAEGFASECRANGINEEKILKRFNFESKEIDLSLSISDSVIFRLSPKTRYFEPSALVGLRDLDFELDKKDIRLIEKHHLGHAELNDYEAIRLKELSSLHEKSENDFANNVLSAMPKHLLSRYISERLENEQEINENFGFIHPYLTNKPLPELRSHLPSGEDFFFINAAANNQINGSEINTLASSFNVSQECVADLKEQGLIKSVDDESYRYLQKLASELKKAGENESYYGIHNASILAHNENLDDRKFESLTKDGFIIDLKKHEEQFLAAIEEKPQSNIEETVQKYFITGKRLDDLRRVGYIDFIGENEKDYFKALKEGKPDDLLEKIARENEIPYYRSKALKSRITYKSEQSVQSVDLTGFPSEKEIKYLEDYKAISNSLVGQALNESIKDLNKILGFDNKNLYRLKNRLDFYPPKTIDKIDEGVNINTSIKSRLYATSFYNESESLLAFREKETLSYKIADKQAQDQYLLLHKKLGSQDHLYKKQHVRQVELLTANEQYDEKFLLNNKEKAFVSTLKNRVFRKNPGEEITTVIAGDFKVSKDRASEMMTLGMIRIEEDHEKSKPKFKVHINYKEPTEISEARIYLNSPVNHRKVLESQDITKPDGAVASLLKDKVEPFEVKNKLGDYRIYFKNLRQEPLNRAEKERLTILRENGSHPESADFRKFIHEVPSSFNMQGARKSAFLEHYKKSYGINRDALDWVNRFKQLSGEQLCKYLGLTIDELARYEKGVKGKSGKPTGAFPLLNKHRQFTEYGPVTFYSLSHNGAISGRAVMEEKLPKDRIAKMPQNRSDLINHDLKVVDCVWKVKKELEAKKRKIIDIKNESTQYGDAKRGIVNEKRTGGPAFMDASIILNEEVVVEGSKTRSKVIAVEYGNYDPSRMVEKIAHSKFDEAHIFASPHYIRQYKKFIGEIPNVYFRSI